MTRYNRCAAVAILSLCSLAGAAQSDSLVSDRTITNARMIAIGATNILDTYLSPEKYSGTELRYVSHTVRERDGRRWSRQIVHQGDIAYADNRSGEGGEIAGAYNFQYLWHRNWTLSDGNLRLKVGGGADADVGFIYNTRNGNNPAQARLSLDAVVSAAVAYSFPLFGRRATARYEAAVPIAGLMFSPNYGQSYYEIFSQGNYDHNIVPTTLFSTPSVRQMLTLDAELLGITWRIGYLGDIQQSHVNNLKSHIYTHAIVVGVVKRFRLINYKL